MDFFSYSEMASLCLRDVKRSQAFREAIRRTVRHGDVVLDAGAGSGILAFFAAQAGARKVYAVEIDEAVCDRLRDNAERNGLASVVEVICSDVRDLTLPGQVDVVVAEMIETWLFDELQVPALNALRRNGVIGPDARMIPGRYEAFITFGHVDFNCYGFQIPFPIHDWPDLDKESGWHPLPFLPLAAPVKVFDANFSAVIDPKFKAVVRITPSESATVNAVRLSGVAHLGGGVSVAETVAFNGNKVLPLSEVSVVAGQPVTFHLSGFRGGASGLVQFACVPEPERM